MPTTLLLDGPDLEALLVRARQEGGPNARITRAEKVRRGGVMGFFAREVFEVAVEVPDGYVPEAQQPRQAQPAKQLNQDGVRPAMGAGAGPANGATDSATDTATDADPFDAVVRAIAAMGAADAAGVSAAAGAAEADLGALNAAGVSGTASRVRKAQRAATARAYSAGGYTSGGQVVGPTPSDDPTSTRFGGSSTGSFAATALLDRLEGRDGDGPLHPVPHESPLDPTNPSTEQPAFTTLLDQLRREALDPSSSPETVPETMPKTAPGFAPGFAPLIPAQAKVSPGLAVRPVAIEPGSAEPVTCEQLSIESVEVSDLTDRPTDQPTDRPTGTARPRSRRPVDPQLKADRALLRALGVPMTLTRTLRAGDRFTAVRQMLGRLPVLDVDGDAPVVAVVGPSALVALEAHRVAVDLAVGPDPRPVLALRPDDARQRGSVVEASRRLDSVVVALTADSDPAAGDHVRPDLRDLRAQVVVAVIDARHPIEQTRAWLRSLGRVDALAVEHAGEVADPARVLELGIPVVRVDGVGMDPLGWTALICARLADAGQRAGRRGAEEA